MKKLLALCISIILVITITAITAYASNPGAPYGDCNWVYISSTQSSVSSATVYGTYKEFGGQNYSTSTRALTISSMYYDASSGWKYDKKIKVSINTTLNDTRTSQFEEGVTWKVNLAPYALYSSGCNGEGYIWYN